MSQKIDAAVLNTFADVLERIQVAVSSEYKKAESGSATEVVLSKLDDILSTEVENLRDMADDNDEDDDE